jgi:tRNA threonylcarbamoyladenosine biosynthesis protein TsaB
MALLAASATTQLPPGRYLVKVDALRGDAYVAECTIGAGGEVVEIDGPKLRPAAEAHPSIPDAHIIGPGQRIEAVPAAVGILRLGGMLGATRPVALDSWEPQYGRPAEAQAKWEAAHGRPLAHG